MWYQILLKLEQRGAHDTGCGDGGILSFSFTEKTIPNVIISHRYKAQDTPARKTFEQALTGAFMSAVIKDLRPSALPFVASLIRHYTMVAVAQQCGELAAWEPGPSGQAVV